MDDVANGVNVIEALENLFEQVKRHVLRNGPLGSDQLGKVST